ncbi:MAG TPA: adenylate/guanylate cyclase domain-containing protein, partial [Coleofasciculaceae cyanobacterium]
LKQQKEIQRRILNALDSGIIYTDNYGLIVSINKTAKQWLQRDEEEPLEGKPISEILPIQDSNWVNWFQDILSNQDSDEQQFYPDRVLKIGNKKHRIDVSIKSIAEAGKPNKSHGILVVFQNKTEEKRIKNINYSISQKLTDELINNHNFQQKNQNDASVLFSDIREYSTLIQGMDKETAISTLNEYFEVMVDAIFQYKGTFDTYINDALVAIFGSPVSLDDHAWCAVQATIEMRQRLANLNHQRMAKNQQPIRIAMGITSDEVMSGNIGVSQRMELKVMGEGVNFASHLGELSWQYGCDVIISETTYRACGDRIWARELDRIRVKDKSQPVSIYELIGLRSEPLSPEKQNLIEHYQKGRQYYLECQFAAAMSEFAQVLAIDSRDKATALHIRRCLHGLESPAPHIPPFQLSQPIILNR